MLHEGRPVYTIGTAAEILGVHPRTLRLYEDGGLIRPARKHNRRFYSASDLRWINCIRYLIHEKGLNQEGLRRLLALIPCWQINGCSDETKAGCAAPADRGSPCWDLARRGETDAKKCYECEVYLSAWDYVLNEAEKEEAMRYPLAG
jgi:MerR family transcriptional regulator, heat shock protein HspR